MEIDPTYLRFVRIFVPEKVAATESVSTNHTRFAYYTSADTAMKVIENEVLYLRNATVMNDFSEISYGLDLIRRAFASDTGERFRGVVDKIFPDTMKKVDERFRAWMRDWQLETYIACISVHDPREDTMGRLSMWRAYGDTALVVKNTPIAAVTDALGVFSVSVDYLTVADFEKRLAAVADRAEAEAAFITQHSQEKLISHIQEMLFATAISTKHPGFAEEQEWRIYYRPSERSNPVVQKKIVVLGGVAQTIYELPLKDDPENGLYGASIPSLLDRLIIGPTEYPYVTVAAFREALRKKGVENVESKVIASDIPLRSG